MKTLREMHLLCTVPSKQNTEIACELLSAITAAAEAGDALALGPQSVENLYTLLSDLLRYVAATENDPEIRARALMRLQCADVPREPWHEEVCEILRTDAHSLPNRSPREVAIHQAILPRIEELMVMDGDPNSPEGMELNLLATVAEFYERDCMRGEIPEDPR